MLVENQSRKILYDRSLWLLIFSNALTIVIAQYQHWNILTMLWVYFFQGVIIGFFNFVHFFSIKEVKFFNVIVNVNNHFSSLLAKIVLGMTFASHYSTFHFVYMVVLLDNDGPIARITESSDPVQWKIVFISAIIFLLNHSFSYFYNLQNDEEKVASIVKRMVFPYLRTLPMYGVVAAGAFIGSGFMPIFLVLKVVIDCFMHVVEHNGLFFLGNSQPDNLEIHEERRKCITKAIKITVWILVLVTFGYRLWKLGGLAFFSNLF